jgi:hypothetical protein
MKALLVFGGPEVRDSQLLSKISGGAEDVMVITGRALTSHIWLGRE